MDSRAATLTVLARSPLDATGQLDLLSMVNDFVSGQALRAGEMEKRRGTDPAFAQAAFEYARELLRSGRYPFIEAMSREARPPPADRRIVPRPARAGALSGAVMSSCRTTHTGWEQGSIRG